MKLKADGALTTHTAWLRAPYADAPHAGGPVHDPEVLAERVRWIEVAWFCLGIPLLALWIRRLTGAWTAGFQDAPRAARYFATSSPETRPPGPVADMSQIVAGSTPASRASFVARGVH